MLNVPLSCLQVLLQAFRLLMHIIGQLNDKLISLNFRYIYPILRRPTVPILGQPNPGHIPTSHLLQIHPNIIHPSTPRSPQWSLSLRFNHQEPIQSTSPQPYEPHAQPISFFSILPTTQYWVRNTNHLSPRYAVLGGHL